VSAKNQPLDEAEADEMRRRKKRDKELRDEIDAHNVRAFKPYRYSEKRRVVFGLLSARSDRQY
jgi:hypothetical protein